MARVSSHPFAICSSQLLSGSNPQSILFLPPPLTHCYKLNSLEKINWFSITVKSRDALRPFPQPYSGYSGTKGGSSLLEAVLLALVKEICLGTAQIDYLRAAIPILLLDGALLAVIGIRDSWTSTDHTAPLVRPIVTLITYAHKCAGSHI